MNWIQQSAKRSKKLRIHYKMHDIDIFIKDALPKHIDVDLVFSTISRSIPTHLFRGVDIVYVGQFDIFNEKEVNAVFQDGAIYVTNLQDSEDDMIDDIIHELAHSVESVFKEQIYSDNLLKNEFVGKRRRIHDILYIHKYDPPITLKSEFHYERATDMYLYKTVGYDTLWNIIPGLFPTPYSVTSLREYFAIGFEQYYMNNKSSLKNCCPILYSKIEMLEFLEDR